MSHTTNAEHPLQYQANSITCAACAALKDNPEAEKPYSGQLFYVIDNKGTGKY